MVTNGDFLHKVHAQQMLMELALVLIGEERRKEKREIIYWPFEIWLPA